jgi:DNA-binding NarL/FixJ family response regulator
VDTPYAPDHAIRVAIKSERRLFRDALANCVAAHPEYTVVGHGPDVNDLLFLVDLRRPDVVLFDLGPSVRPTVDGLLALRERFDLAHVVLVYERLNPAELAAVWHAGVGTVVPCSHGLDALLVVLQRYAAGHAEYDGPPTEGAAGLTDQEREIITLVSAGHTATRIAELLDISLHTVDNCKRRIYQKLEVGSQSHAVARAAVLGIVERPILSMTRIKETNGGSLYAVVGGRDSPTRQAVVSTLRDSGIAFSLNGSLDRPPTLAILVDPDGTDWPDPDAPRVPVVLVHSAPLCRATVISALVRGLAGIVPGDRTAHELVQVLRLAARGYLVLDHTEARTFIDAAWARRAEPESGLPDLTARECDILRSIASGHTVRQTARSLGIAEKTVENTQARLFRKLGVRNRAGALATAYALGLLDLPIR